MTSAHQDWGELDSSDHRQEDYRSQAFKPKTYGSEESTPKDPRPQAFKPKDCGSQELTDLQVLAREQEASEYQLILTPPAVLVLCKIKRLID